MMRQIVAMGGGGFTMHELTPALDRFVLELTGKPVPKVCFLPTASGDPREQVTRFYERFSDWPCEPSTLSLFHLGRDRIDPVEHLLSQDAIYVGGGSMRNMLAVWREHHLDQADAGLAADAPAHGRTLKNLSVSEPPAVAVTVSTMTVAKIIRCARNSCSVTVDLPSNSTVRRRRAAARDAAFITVQTATEMIRNT